ncbi:MAG: hypothetical protein ACYC42_04495, partial [Lysobacter sp.]
MLFVIAMLVMASSAVAMAAFLRPNRVNAIAGVLTFYLPGLHRAAHGSATRQRELATVDAALKALLQMHTT